MDSEKYPYVGLDLETTGFNPEKDEIIEISAIEFNLKGEVGEKFHSLCYPISGHIPSGASKVNNIYIDMLKGAPNYFEGGVREELAKFIGLRTVVGHNLIKFDAPFLKINLKAMEDTLVMCRKKYSSGNNLKSACKRKGIAWNDTEAHRSEYDTLKCIELFCAMKTDEKPKDESNLDLFKNLPGVSRSDLSKIGVVPSDDDKKMLATQAYSYSRINLFHQCPFKWYMRYIKRHPDPGASYLLVGTICHSIAEWSGDWCSRQLFSNKLNAYIEATGEKVPETPSKEPIGTYLYNNPHEIKNYFPKFKGRASLMMEIDSVVEEDAYERPSMPDWETYQDLMQEAFRRHKCTDTDIVSDVTKVMTRFFDKSDFSLCTGEVTITEKRLAFNKNWEILKDFYSNEAFFRAVLDVINFFGDRVVVRDYKSSRSMLKQEQLLEDRQMQIYLLMIFMFLPKGSYKTITLEIDYIRFGKQISVDITEDQIEGIAQQALKWINDSIQEIESEVLKDDGTAFQPRRNEHCHTCYLAEESKCPLFDKRVQNPIDDPENFVITDVEDCVTAWKRIEANKVENARLTKVCKEFVKKCESEIVIDDKAVLDFYVEEDVKYNADAIVKKLLNREVDIKYIMKFLKIDKSSFESLCEKQGIVFTDDELENLTKRSTRSSFKALTEAEVKKGKFLNS